MIRPICPKCNQRPKAIAYYKYDRIYYRSKCSVCLKKIKNAKPAKPRWQLDGYKKKPTCDRCGFKARYNSQLLVYHLDGNLNHSDLRNLRTVCLNCVEEVKQLDVPWVPNPLQADH